MNVLFNEDRTRCAREMPFGVACYEGMAQDGEFRGTHRGIVRDWDEAETWLAGTTPPSFLRVYGVEGKKPEAQ